MKTQHTPGPWEGERSMNTDALLVTVEDGEIAQVFDINENRETGNANARLIVAAPDLLEACESALILLKEIGDDKGLVSQKINKALAKAKGN